MTGCCRPTTAMHVLTRRHRVSSVLLHALHALQHKCCRGTITFSQVREVTVIQLTARWYRGELTKQAQEHAISTNSVYKSQKKLGNETRVFNTCSMRRVNCKKKYKSVIGK